MRTGRTEIVLRALLVVAALSLSFVTSCGAAPPRDPTATSAGASGSHLRIEPQLGHGEVVSLATFSSTGAYLLTGSADRSVILWDATTGAQLRTISLPDDSEAVAATKKFFGFPEDQSFYVPDDALANWRKAIDRGAEQRQRDDDPEMIEYGH